MSKFTLKTSLVETADGNFEVRGLSPSQIQQLYDTHKPIMDDLFKRFNGRDPNTISEDEVKSTAMGLIQEIPTFVGHVIALGADAVDEFETIVQLPFGTQFGLIERIGELTFASGGGPKKLFGLISSLIQKGRSNPTASRLM